MKKMFNSCKYYCSLINDLFSTLDERSICYCLLRNFEDLPEYFSGDIDFIVNKEDLPEIEKIISDLKKEEYFIVKSVEKNAHRLLYLMSFAELSDAIKTSRPAEPLILDFLTDKHWKGIIYLTGSELIARRQRYKNFYIASDIDRVTHDIVHSILNKKKPREDLIDLLRNKTNKSLDKLQEKLFDDLGISLYSTGVLDDTDLWNDCLGRLGTRLKLNFFYKRPNRVFGFAVFYLKSYIRIADQIINPPGILVATGGPDGAGKTTLLKTIGHTLKHCFNPTTEVYMGWKDFILPTKRLLLALHRLSKRDDDKKECDTDTKKSRQPTNSNSDNGQKHSWTHNISVLHYFIDLWVRYILRIRPAMARGGLVLCDRYFFDFVMQDVFITRNQLARKIMVFFSPKPTLTIIFGGNADVIAARKDENTPRETARQIAEFQQLKNYHFSTIELDALRNLENNVLDTVVLLLRK